MKTNAIVRIVIWSIVLLVLIGILTTGISWNLFGIHRSSTTADAAAPVESVFVDPTAIFSSDAEGVRIDASQIRKIKVDWAAGSITVVPGDGESIVFTESASSDEDDRMVWDQSGDVLTIQYSKRINSIGIHINDISKKDLTIVVPRNWAGDSLNVDAASAKLDVRDLTLREVDIDTASGVCVFENCTVDSLDIDTASGDVRYRGSLAELDVEAASASFTGILTSAPSRISMDSMSGGLELTLPENTGFTVDMDTMSGKFTSDFPTTTKNGTYISGDGSCRISVSAMSGDVKIQKAG